MWSLSVVLLLAVADASDWPWESTRFQPNFLTRNASRECGVVPKFNREKCDVSNPFETFFAQYPWQVAIVLRPNYVFLCSGALVSSDIVLTSASCVTNPVQMRDFSRISSLRVRLGDWDILQHNKPLAEPFQHLEVAVQRLVVHPAFELSASLSRFDLAVLFLDEPLPWDEYPHVSPICLPDSTQMSEDLTRADCWVAGWSQSPLGNFQNCCGSKQFSRRGAGAGPHKPQAPSKEPPFASGETDSFNSPPFMSGRKFGSGRFSLRFDGSDDLKARPGRDLHDEKEAEDSEQAEGTLKNKTRGPRQASRGDIPIEEMEDLATESVFEAGPSPWASSPSRLLYHSQIALLGPNRCSVLLRRPLGDDVFCGLAASLEHQPCLGDVGSGIICALPRPSRLTTTVPWRHRRQAKQTQFRVSEPPMPSDAHHLQMTLVGIISKPAACQPNEIIVAVDIFEMIQFINSQMARTRL